MTLKSFFRHNFSILYTRLIYYQEQCTLIVVIHIIIRYVVRQLSILVGMHVGMYSVMFLKCMNTHSKTTYSCTHLYVRFEGY